MLGQGDLVELRVLDARGGEPARRAVAILEAVEDGALLRRPAELGAAGLQLGVVVVEVQRGLRMRGADAVHPRLRSDEVVAAARGDGGAARRVLRVADRELGVLEHRLAAQALAEARGERLLCELLVVLAQLAKALEAEVVARHLGGVVGHGVRRFSRRWTDGGYARRVRRCVVLLATVVLVAGCSKGTVSNDDDVSRRAATQAVERFFAAIHDGREAAACAQIPGPQRGGLGRLSARRGGPGTCEGALRTLPEYAPARARGALKLSHDIGFKSALPHRSKTAVDNVSVNGRDLPSIGLRRNGNTWSIAVVCDCP
jgi:hypothetical protein